MDPHAELCALLEEAFPADRRAHALTDPAERLRRCLARRDSAQRQRIQSQVRALLGRGLCDVQLADLLAFELGCHLRPAEMGCTPAEWLDWVGRQARTA